MTLLWATFSFLCGALPFSVWIGRYGLGKDITQFGDGNPGATNVLRAGGRGWYAFALFLDMTKGILPVGLANMVAGIDGFPLVLIAIMPPLGHAFSPFLKGNGGKALAAAAGVWFGLGIPLFIAAIAGIVLFSLLVKPSGYAVFGAMGCILATAFWMNSSAEIYAIWITQILLFLWKQRDDLKQRPAFYWRGRNTRNQTPAKS